MFTAAVQVLKGYQKKVTTTCSRAYKDWWVSLEYTAEGGH